MPVKEAKAQLAVDFCGLRFVNPFLLASGPPASNGELIKRAFALGWAGAVTKTIGPEEMLVEDVSPRFASLRGRGGDIVAFENIELISPRPLRVWVQEIESIKQSFPDRVLVASIMAEVEKKAWQDIAWVLQKAGADALELNFSCPHGMPERGMGSAIGQDEDLTRTITSWVKEAVDIPVIVKLTPNVTDIGRVARAAMEGGADGLAAINTVSALIGVDLETLRPLPSVGGQSTFGGLSGPAVKPIGLRCVAQIAQSCDLPISGMGGIRGWQEAVEYILLGATTVQICTEVMIRGLGMIDTLIRGLQTYLASKGVTSIEELRGQALSRLTTHALLPREQRVFPVLVRERCSGCRLCVAICRDIGFAALSWSDKEGLIIDYTRCDGCSLCANVCSAFKITGY
ncbi:NAD-dependent dihydropyrimidine dehydrogenase subunit PreA [Thermatribacter velox]|uniref:dihydrouracil dehydrogenase (NAD(+)) n=1 Tax=Thermatribacter velox TaxID=3039681 RepID=A0ABZ2YAK2_9BACT